MQAWKKSNLRSIAHHKATRQCRHHESLFLCTERERERETDRQTDREACLYPVKRQHPRDLNHRQISRRLCALPSGACFYFALASQGGQGTAAYLRGHVLHLLLHGLSVLDLLLGTEFWMGGDPVKIACDEKTVEMLEANRAKEMVEAKTGGAGHARPMAAALAAATSLSGRILGTGGDEGGSPAAERAECTGPAE
jgi:hypothetical protein